MNAVKPRPEYRPQKLWPKTINLDCGCELSLEHHKPEKKGDVDYYYYVVTGLCEDHDPSYWSNYSDDDKCDEDEN
jgi:hypothetical protein